jgi:hypothetical protein
MIIRISNKSIDHLELALAEEEFPDNAAFQQDC